MQYRTKGLAQCCGEEAKIKQCSRENKGARFSCLVYYEHEFTLEVPGKCLQWCRVLAGVFGAEL